MNHHDKIYWFPKDWYSFLSCYLLNFQMTDRFLSAPILFLQIISAVSVKLPKAQSTPSLSVAVYARVAARCYQHHLQVFGKLRVFWAKVGSAHGSLAAAGFVLKVKGGQGLDMILHAIVDDNQTYLN
jgi:hypothetical protein